MPYTKDQIKDAPNVGDAGHLSEAEEQNLYRHYNIPFTTDGSTFADTTGGGRRPTDTRFTDPKDTTSSEGTVDYDTSTAGNDDAMTRSEEQLNVGTERVQTGKARLRKWVETENVQVDVPVRKEKATLVSEPITDANRGDAFAGADISEAEHEVTLNEERPVVSKETVPVERVHLDKDVEESVETVGGDVRKERIDLDGDADVDDRR